LFHHRCLSAVFGIVPIPVDIFVLFRPRAVAILFERFSDLILGIGLKVLRDRGEAEDFVQDFFLALFNKVKGFDPAKGTARTWIVQIGYRRAFDRRAYLARREFYNGTDLGDLENTLSDAVRPEEHLADLIAGDRLHAAFEELAERHRATLEMYFFEGRDLREISERLGETLENTRHFFYRGLDRLRSIAAVQAHRGKKGHERE
jgi:RNA polymerase sigma-70 factor, ECF subfamily